MQAHAGICTWARWNGQQAQQAPGPHLQEGGGQLAAHGQERPAAVVDGGCKGACGVRFKVHGPVRVSRWPHAALCARVCTCVCMRMFLRTHGVAIQDRRLHAVWCALVYRLPMPAQTSPFTFAEPPAPQRNPKPQLLVCPTAAAHAHTLTYTHPHWNIHSHAWQPPIARATLQLLFTCAATFCKGYTGAALHTRSHLPQCRAHAHTGGTSWVGCTNVRPFIPHIGSALTCASCNVC